ncbi:hypothetical protein [Mangrovibacterium diazotrophicum]|uniref:Outer membrane protein with beta-barrel domain n=1 Tax=Mangrovibacterium diazotrophicum TaxID=1261403 RepID=A0A419VWM7_9BACT|nr:hypothetical protein [Mangrovibacterium diazotrophicum]RKD86553.1 hypothetical protein BC643_4251 [Mangrovibacterium diazotrophicum]
MKKMLSLCAFCLMYTWAFAQIEFIPGYVLKADGTRTECQIEDKEWRNSPDLFNFKIGDKLFKQSASSDSIIGFGIEGGAHYVRYAGELDQSSDVLSSVSSDIEPELHQVTVYLKVLLQGDLSLLCYDRQGTVRYLYQRAGEMPVPLEWKMYYRDQQIYYNNRFRKQLSAVLNCDAIVPKDLYHIAYEEKALKNIFARYNTCVGAEVETYERIKKANPFYISVIASGNYNSFNIESGLDSQVSAGPEQSIGASIGINFEKFLPFNKNKWAIIFEPVFEYLKSDLSNDYPNNRVDYEVDYKGVSLNAGLRHYFYLRNQNALFVNAACDYNLALGSKIVCTAQDFELELGNVPRFSLGIGYHCNKRVNAELRYYTNRNLANGYTYWVADVKTLSFVLSYRIKE